MSLGDLAVLGVGREQHVGRLEVAVHDAGGVRGVEAPAEPLRDLERALDRHRPAPDEVGQRLAAHVLHDDEGRIADDEIEEARDVGMLDGGDRLRLGLEARAELGVGEQLRLEQLDRHAHADGDVLGDEDLAHAAGAERLDELVAAADDLADDRADARPISLSKPSGSVSMRDIPPLVLSRTRGYETYHGPHSASEIGLVERARGSRRSGR